MSKADSILDKLEEAKKLSSTEMSDATDIIRQAIARRMISFSDNEISFLGKSKELLIDIKTGEIKIEDT